MDMVSETLLTELHRLSRAEKLRVVQILVNALTTEEEALLSPDREDEAWSPYDSADTARSSWSCRRRTSRQTMAEPLRLPYTALTDARSEATQRPLLRLALSCGGPTVEASG
jgi:hypothetical protein